MLGLTLTARLGAVLPRHGRCGALRKTRSGRFRCMTFVLSPSYAKHGPDDGGVPTSRRRKTSASLTICSPSVLASGLRVLRPGLDHLASGPHAIVLSSSARRPRSRGSRSRPRERTSRPKRTRAGGAESFVPAAPSRTSMRPRSRRARARGPSRRSGSHALARRPGTARRPPVRGRGQAHVLQHVLKLEIGLGLLGLLAAT
jgi:hypothetical protein